MIALLITLFLAPATSDATTLVGEQAKLTVKYDKGAVTILRIERQPLTSPMRMPRWRGRFEARAVGAGKTIDFVRFDFPLMAEAESPDDATVEAQALGKKLRDHVTATAIVRAPVPRGATSIAIYDSVTKKTTSADLPAASPAPAPAPPGAGGAGSTRR